MLLVLSILVGMASIASCEPPSTLRLVNLLYRHGDRSPVYIYPKDKHQVRNTWPDGLGWLSNIGKEQQFELGRYIGQRYDGFLNITRYNHEEIVIEASGVERCLMSAYSNLAGLFPPEGDQVWRDDLPWQPIPVETRPVTEDNKLAMNAPCARYDQLQNELFQTPAIKKLDSDNKDLFLIIENATGIKNESIKDIWALIDDLIVERAHNLTWNDWAYKPHVWDRIYELQSESFKLLFKTTGMAKLKGGVLLKEIIQNMQNAATQETISPKVFMYSAHDTTVAALLRALNTDFSGQPPYASLVMVELHQINNIYEVKILFRNDSTVEPYEMHTKDCKDPCTLDSFMKATKENIPGDWKAECKAKENSSSSLSIASWIALAVGGGICLLIAVIFGISIVRHCKKTTVAYAQL